MPNNAAEYQLLVERELDPNPVNLKDQTTEANSYSDWHIFRVPAPGDGASPTIITFDGRGPSPNKHTNSAVFGGLVKLLGRRSRARWH
jgi:hypothetical protein